MKIKLRTVVTTLLTMAVLVGAGWLVLINPNNAVTRFFSNSISDVKARIVIGPYPLDEDFKRLKSAKIGLIVTLLNPEIPYEDVLLKQEQERSNRFGIPLKNFPMSSILGQRFGDSYDESAVRAAEAIASFQGKVYLHCYLGIHRIQVVRDILTKQGIEAGRYSLRKGERGKKTIQLDQAELAFNQGRYEDALGIIEKIGGTDITPAALLLRAWCYFRLGQIPQAQAAFETLLVSSPDNVSGNTGVGYCYLRGGDLPGAESAFGKAVAKEPGNVDALSGLGITLYRLGRLEEAAEKLDAALKIAPNPELQSILDQIRGN